MIAAGVVVMIAIVIAGNVVSGGHTSLATHPTLAVGSCLQVLENLDVAVVRCTDRHDGVADRIVAFGQNCPVGLEAHRDRQGLGIACMRRTAEPTTT
jgi:molecular chaperone DnaJ